MLKFFERHFGLVIASGILVGLISGDLVQFNSYVITGLLMLLMFVSALKVDFASLLKSFKSPFWIIFLLIAKLFLAPILVFIIFANIIPEYQVAIILLASVPAAVAGPGIISLLKGEIKVGLIVTVLSNLLVPFTIPLVLYYTVGTKIDIDIYSMFVFLLWIIMIPFALAFVFQKSLKKLTKSISSRSGAIVTLICFIFMIVAIGPYNHEIIGNFKESLNALIFAFVLSIFFHLIGFLLAIRAKREMLVTSIVTMAYTNAGLGIVLAAKYFDSTTLLTTVFYEIPWAVGLIFMQMLFGNKLKSKKS